MEYKLSEQELKDLMHRTWLKAKNFYKGKTDEYFYDYFESEKNKLESCNVLGQSEQLFCVVDYLSNFTKGKMYECKPNGKNHFEVCDDFGDWYSVHKKCFNLTKLAK